MSNIQYNEATKRKLYKCKSSVDLVNDPTAILPNRVRPSLGIYSIPRCTSTPDLAAAYNEGSYISSQYRPSIKIRHSYNRQQVGDLFEDYLWDYRNNSSQLFWPTRNWPDRRYHYYNDKHASLWQFYPALGNWPKYERGIFLGGTDPISWYKYRDPAYSTAYCNQYRPWSVTGSDRGLSASLYRSKIINYDTVERNWLAPKRFNRWLDDNASYPHKASTWYTSPRRYFYSFDGF